MKTKEFTKRVEELGYRCYEYADSIAITAGVCEFTIAVIDKKEMYSFVIGSSLAIDNPEIFITDKLFELIVEYVRTPPEDREEEKKFYLRHRWFKSRSIYNNYLNHLIGTNEYWLDYNNETNEVQTQFTRKQIEEIKEKFDTDLADFKEVEIIDE